MDVSLKNGFAAHPPYWNLHARIPKLRISPNCTRLQQCLTCGPAQIELALIKYLAAGPPQRSLNSIIPHTQIRSN